MRTKVAASRELEGLVEVPPARRRSSLRGGSRRSSAIEVVGRVAVITVTIAILSVGTGSDSATWALALSLCWILAVQLQFSGRSAELEPLGSSVPAARGALLGLVVGSAAAYWLDATRLDWADLFVATVAIWLGLVVWQAAFGRLLATRKRILLIGDTTISHEIVRELESEPSAPFDVVGCVGDGTSPDVADGAVLPYLGSIEDLPDTIERERPDIVVVALDRNRPTTFGHLLDSASLGFRVVEAAQFFEHAFGRVPVRDVTRSWFMSILHLYQRPYSRLTKRVLDLVLGSVGLLFTLPLFPLVAIAVKLTPGPLLIKQTRVGEHGRPFTILKFRTMRVDAEAPGQPRWSTSTDPRVTRTGRLLRRLRLDELPQFFNVLRGDMSIVGPRPERPEFMQFLEERVPFWTRRHLVKPGITGWAQVRRGYTSDAEGTVDKLSYDLWYLRHRSVLVDLAICAKTFGVILRGGVVIGPSADPDSPARAADRAKLAELVPRSNGGHSDDRDTVS